MRRPYLLPLGLVLIVVVALPVAALTNTGLEREIKSDLGFGSGECEPVANLASPWATGASLAYKLDEPRGAAVDGKVYLAGGITGLSEAPQGILLLEPSDELTRFDPRTERYEELAPLPRPMSHMGVVAYDHDLYVVGGYGSRLNTDTSAAFYRYDPDRNRWSRMPDMPEPRAAMAAGVIGHRLIVAGGARNNVAESDAYSFDFRTGRWSRLPNMLSQREHVGGVAVGDELYVLGGRMREALASNIAEAYDAATGRWTSLPPMPVEAGGLTAVKVNGAAVAVGGGNDGAQTVTGAVQAWDPRSEAWSLLPAMRMPRHGQAVASVADKIWVFGGSVCANFNPTDSVESFSQAPG